jgi:Ca-activated chloride channel family protein
VTVSALGIGADYDDAYLADLANAGRGNYEFLASTSSLERFLSRELRETRQTTIQNVLAHLDLPPNAVVTDVWGANWERTSDGARLTFGSMFTGDERRAVVSFTADAGPPGSWFTVSGRVTWRPVGGREVRHTLAALRVESVSDPEQVDNARDFSVLASVTSVQASQRELEAARAFEHGDRSTALRLNEENKVALDEAAGKATGVAADRIRSQQRAYKDNRDVYSTTPPSAAPARAIGARESANISDAYSY